MDKAPEDTLSGQTAVPQNSTVVASGSLISPTIKALLFSVCSVCILLIITLVVCLVYKCYFVRRRVRRTRTRPHNEPPPKSYDTVRIKILGKVRDSLTMALTTRSREALVRNCAQDGVCSICLDSYLNQSDSPDAKLGILKKCNHFFHFDCVWRWLEKNSSCPICRKSMSINTKHIQAIPVSAVTRSLPPMKSPSSKYGSRTKSTISSLNSSEHGSGVRNTIEKTRNQQPAMAASADSIQGIYAKNVNGANKQNRPLPPTPVSSSRMEDETSVLGKDEPVYVEVNEYSAIQTNATVAESVLTVSDENVCARGSGDFSEDRMEPNLVVSTKACLNFEEPELEEEAVVEFSDDDADDAESAQNSNKINSIKERMAKLKKEHKPCPFHSTHVQDEAGENKPHKRYDAVHPKEKTRDNSSTSAPCKEQSQLCKVPSGSSEVCNVHGHARDNHKQLSRSVSSSESSSTSKSSNGKQKRRSEVSAASNTACEVHSKRNSVHEGKEKSDTKQHACPEHHPSHRETPCKSQAQPQKETAASTKRHTPKQAAPVPPSGGGKQATHVPPSGGGKQATHVPPSGGGKQATHVPPSGGGKTHQQSSSEVKAIHAGKAAAPLSPPPGTNIVGIAHGQAEIVYPYFASQKNIAASSKTPKQHR